ncbi:TrkH family potassium uptake protein [Pararhodobacter sp. SW119]|uniref:TrkH family potassium uptake protein n=1 Tax=Pararhodobacter sp. SW119 TaxID=2780075 RepID=UPI001AE04F3B|nr:TrkH family potassium uptake protein [Pararhodobacter sp. SW119]
MPDLRPVAHIIGLMLVALGVMMLIPAAVAVSQAEPGWAIFLQSAVATMLTGCFLALSTLNALTESLTLRQSFLLTTLTWVILPAFGAMPFFLGPGGERLVDALFESMSGMTTTGTTIMVGLDEKPDAILLWRSILQWLGGLGIVIVALVFLPVMKVGGMQYFRAEGFDTLGKILPRVRDISLMLIEVYLALTVAAAVAYVLAGMSAFDAINHALTTIATGGFSTRDTSFGEYSAAAQYAAIALMWLAGLPFIRYIQLVNGDVRPLLQDVQVRAYFRWTLYAIALIVGYRLLTRGGDLEAVIRESAFNLVSLMSGTGYGSADITAWGDFVLLVVLMAGFIGACTASTGCSIKVFRYLVLFEAIRAQLRQLVHPSRVAPIHLQGRRVEEDVITSVVVLFTAFVLGFGLLAVALSLTGLQMRASITAAWTAIGNIGPAFGREVGPTGAVDGFPDSAKWLMMLGMLLGRLEMVAVLVLLLPRFWRN